MPTVHPPTTNGKHLRNRLQAADCQQLYPASWRLKAIPTTDDFAVNNDDDDAAAAAAADDDDDGFDGNDWQQYNDFDLLFPQTIDTSSLWSQ